MTSLRRALGAISTSALGFPLLEEEETSVERPLISENDPERTFRPMVQRVQLGGCRNSLVP
jgi:hypothetical protein